METKQTSLSGLDILLKQVADNVEQSINEKSQTLIADLEKQVEQLKKYTPTVVINGKREVRSQRFEAQTIE